MLALLSFYVVLGSHTLDMHEHVGYAGVRMCGWAKPKCECMEC